MFCSFFRMFCSFLIRNTQFSRFHARFSKKKYFEAFFRLPVECEPRRVELDFHTIFNFFNWISQFDETWCVCFDSFVCYCECFFFRSVLFTSHSGAIDVFFVVAAYVCTLFTLTCTLTLTFSYTHECDTNISGCLRLVRTFSQSSYGFFFLLSVDSSRSVTVLLASGDIVR